MTSFLRSGFWRAAAMAALLAQGGHALAQAVNSIVIWPIDPTIDSGARATPLWLENPGKRPVVLQIRVFGWSQIDGEDRYVAQKDVIGSPPIARVGAGQRQLVRLTRLVPPPTAGEAAYRVIIDEIPFEPEARAGAAPAQGAGAAIRFRMRYSLPLFVHGGGARDKAAAPDARPQLAWRTVQAGGKDWIEIRNAGAVHARLTHVSLRSASGAPKPLTSVNGYVLPGAAMRWPIDTPPPRDGQVFASINGAEAASLSRAVS